MPASPINLEDLETLEIAHAVLTDREFNACELAHQGYTQAEIAGLLYCSDRTVRRDLARAETKIAQAREEKRHGKLRLGITIVRGGEAQEVRDATAEAAFRNYWKKRFPKRESE